MSFRYWIIAAALVLAVFGEAKAQNPVNAPADSPSIEKATQGQPGDGASSQDDFSFPVRIVEDPIEAQSAKIRADESAERERRDLAAQESVAKSTEQIVVISWFQIALASIGTLALFASLCFNYSATKAAVVSAKAAMASVHAGRAWLSLDVISYDTVDGATITSASDDRRCNQGILFKFGVINIGQTPAIRAAFSYSCKFIDAAAAMPEFETIFPDDYSGEAISVGKGLKGIKLLVDEQISDLIHSRKRLIIYGKAVYFDIFSDKSDITKQHVTEFCFEAHHRGGYALRPDGSRHPVIDFSGVGKQNSQT